MLGMAGVRRRARMVLGSVELPQPWDAAVLAERVGELRGREVVLLPTTVPGDPAQVCGVWLACRDEDLLLYPARAPRWYADVVICHELAHMLLGHGQAGARAPVPRAVLRQWVPDLDPDAVLGVLGRSSFGDRQELEAEYLATLIVDAATAGPSASSADAPGQAARMSSTFVAGRVSRA